MKVLRIIIGLLLLPFYFIVTLLLLPVYSYFKKKALTGEKMQVGEKVVVITTTDKVKSQIQ